MSKYDVAYCVTGSYCMHAKALAAVKELVATGKSVLPIVSENTAKYDTRFGKAADFANELRAITGREVIDSIVKAEPIGPKNLADVLVVAPCTGNTLAKLAASIVDTTVTMAVKSHLRGGKPVVIALSTNDGLAGAAKNIGSLHNLKNYYFVPYYQDDAKGKPASLIADYSQLAATIQKALDGVQLQPIILSAAPV